MTKRLMKLVQDEKNLYRFLEDCKNCADDDVVEAILIYRRKGYDPDYITTTGTLVDSLNSMVDMVKYRLLFERDQEH